MKKNYIWYLYICINKVSSNLVWKQAKKKRIYIYKFIGYEFVYVLYSCYLIKI